MSIITITKDNYSGLLSTYDSVRGHLGRNIEWIIVDGNSTDKTNEFVKTLINVPGIMYHLRDPKGVYDAIQYGIDSSSGSWVHILNAGDRYLNEHSLLIIFESIQYNDSSEDIFMFAYRKNGNTIYPTTPKLGSLGTCHQAIIYRASVLKRFKFDMRMNVFADNYQMTQMLRVGVRYKIIRNAIIEFEIGGVSETKFKQGLFELRHAWIDEYGFTLGYLKWLVWILVLFPKGIERRLNKKT